MRGGVSSLVSNADADADAYADADDAEAEEDADNDGDGGRVCRGNGVAELSRKGAASLELPSILLLLLLLLLLLRLNRAPRPASS